MNKLQSTTININLSIKTDNDFVLLTLLFVLWLIRGIAGRIGYEVKMFAQDLSEALNFTVKVALIGFSSLAFGLGVTA